MAASSMEKIVSLCKRRGFIFPGSEIYGGLAGTYDYGPLGAALKRNIENLWWRIFVEFRFDMFGLDSSVIMSAPVWEASGHLAGFADPMVECEGCKRRFRADQLGDVSKCAECGGKLGQVKMFNLLFPVSMGSMGAGTTAYLRGEIAQGMFVNFKNIIDSFHPRLPFGIAQTGKAFRNEIAPRDFLFRTREFDLMEFEYFIMASEWEQQFEYWRKQMWTWIDAIGLDRSHVHELEVASEDRAHYSKRTIDFEFDYPFGRKELYGLAYRTDYDLSRHIEKSGIDLSYLDDMSGERFVPHVIEPTFGLSRTLLAILCDAYREDEMGGEMRTYLAFSPKIAPVKAMIAPLLKNKPELVEKAKEIYAWLKREIPQVVWDDNGNIGKRYRRQDEIGTPFCITVDFDTLGETPNLRDTVTLRHRDTGEQERLSIPDSIERIQAATRHEAKMC